MKKIAAQITVDRIPFNIAYKYVSLNPIQYSVKKAQLAALTTTYTALNEYVVGQISNLI